jgi:hypothetical protein
MGTHEHYGGDYQLTEKMLREDLSEFKNVYLLEKSSFHIDDYIFIGATIWTDMNHNDPNTLFHVGRVMNDFRVITNGVNQKFKPSDAYDDHLKAMEYIRNVVEQNSNKKCVIVGHHAPSKLSVKPRYQGDNLTNGAYSSDLSEFILDHPQIKLWTHGHTHDVFDYMIGDTRILCNPRGYIYYEDRADEFELLFTDI